MYKVVVKKYIEKNLKMYKSSLKKYIENNVKIYKSSLKKYMRINVEGQEIHKSHPGMGHMCKNITKSMDVSV